MGRPLPQEQWNSVRGAERRGPLRLENRLGGTSDEGAVHAGRARYRGLSRKAGIRRQSGPAAISGITIYGITDEEGTRSNKWAYYTA